VSKPRNVWLRATTKRAELCRNERGLGDGDGQSIGRRVLRRALSLIRVADHEAFDQRESRSFSSRNRVTKERREESLSTARILQQTSSAKEHTWYHRVRNVAEQGVSGF
jgi:hypothetical protein